MIFVIFNRDQLVQSPPSHFIIKIDVGFNDLILGTMAVCFQDHSLAETPARHEHQRLHRAAFLYRMAVEFAAALSLSACEEHGHVKQNLQNRTGFTAVFCATMMANLFRERKLR
jgi:hypothetical protein